MFRSEHGKVYQQRLGPLWEGRSLLLVVGCLITILCLLWVVYPPGMIRFAGHYAYDAMLRARAKGRLTWPPHRVCKITRRRPIASPSWAGRFSIRMW